MAQLLILSSAADTDALPALELLSHRVRVIPAEPASLVNAPTADAVIVDARHDLASAKGLCKILRTTGLDVPLVLGGPPELEARPYGPTGLAEKYGVDVAFQATGDTTVEDLLAGTVNIANVYSADPRIQTEGLVTLDDPKGLFLASNVVPLVNAAIADEIADVINAVSAALTPEGLVDLNVRSTVDQESTAAIATAWLTEQGLI